MAAPIVGGALAGLGSLLTGLTSALSHQSRSTPITTARVDTVTPAMATVTDKRTLRAMAKSAEHERTMAILTDPQVMGLLVTFGGLALASRFPFHPNKRANANMRAVAAASAVLMGLGRAGVGDMTTLALAAGTGGTMILAESMSDDGAGAGAGGSAGGSGGSGLTLDEVLSWGTVYVPGTNYPVASIWGPLAQGKALYDWFT